MGLGTPEATAIPKYNSAGPLKKAPVEVIASAVDVVATIYDFYNAPIINKIVTITVQNRSVQPCFYQTDGDAGAKSGVLGGGSAADDGLGGRVKFDLRAENFSKLTFISKNGALNIQVERAIQ